MDERRRARERAAATGDPAAIAAAAVEACRRGEHQELAVTVEDAAGIVVVDVERGDDTFTADGAYGVLATLQALRRDTRFLAAGGAIGGTFSRGIRATMPCRCGAQLEATCVWPLLARDIDQVGGAFAAFERERGDEMRAVIVRARRDDPAGWAAAERFTLEHGRGSFVLRDHRRDMRPFLGAGVSLSAMALAEWDYERRQIYLERVTWVCSAHPGLFTWDVVQVEGHGDIWPVACPTCAGDQRRPPAPRQSSRPDASSAQSGPPIR